MSKKEYCDVLKVSPYAHRFTFHIKGEILGPEHYTECFTELQQAGSGDVIEAYINSNGGALSTALEIRNIFINSPAHIHCSVAGECKSAATIPLLASDSVEIADHTIFMFHNYSSGFYGNGHEIITNAVFEDKWSRSLWKDIYNGYLTEEEIDCIINGQSVYINAEDARERFKNLEESKNG